jgi:uncharacterized membrane protein
MRSNVNVARAERWASAIGGAALAAYGLKQLRDRTAGGTAIAAAGGTLLLRAATGHCAMYSAAGISTARRRDTRSALSGRRGVHVEEAVTINRPPDELYDFWRDFERLPRFMQNLVSVKRRDNRRSHWVAKAPGGRTVEWDAEVINEIPNELIAWKTIADSGVISAVSVHFDAAGRGRGSRVRVRMQYDPPAGKVGAAIARMLGAEPSQTVREDLRRFKQLMEAGEVPTIEGQSHGKR